MAALVAASTLISTAANAEVKVSTKGGLKVSAGDYSVQIGGRLMYDYNRSELNGEVDEDNFDERRARIFAKGNLGDDWSYKMQFNLDGSGFEDLYLRYGGWGSMANVTIGNQRVPFGLEDQTSSKDISILERSGLSELYPVGRVESVMLHGASDKMTYNAMVFKDEVDEDESGEESGFAARFTYAPIKTKTSVVHLGVAYRDIEDESATGLEAAFATGPFHIQAEYFDGEFDGDDKDGYYLQAGYILTGETRPYKKGIFKRVKPSSKKGAWEVVARYEDGDGNHSDIELGRTDAKALALGVNWYPNNNVRLGINYTDGEDNLSDDEGEEFRVRFQITF